MTQMCKNVSIENIEEAARSAGAGQHVEFLRLPRPGQLCPVTGLSRSYLNSLILPTLENEFRPPVKSFVLRKRAARSGVRLIDRESLVTYIRAHQQQPGEPAIEHETA
jgi:hypothetical protein